MAEENLSREKSRETKTTLEKIEGLIVDGQKDVLEKLAKVEGRLDGRISEVEERLGGRLERVEDGQKKIIEKMKEMHSNLKSEIEVTALAVKETVREEIKRVGDKLDEHIRMPVHAGV